MQQNGLSQADQPLRIFSGIWNTTNSVGAQIYFLRKPRLPDDAEHCRLVSSAISSQALPLPTDLKKDGVFSLINTPVMEFLRSKTGEVCRTDHLAEQRAPMASRV